MQFLESSNAIKVFSSATSFRSFLLLLDSFLALNSETIDISHSLRYKAMHTRVSWQSFLKSLTCKAGRCRRDFQGTSTLTVAIANFQLSLIHKRSKTPYMSRRAQFFKAVDKMHKPQSRGQHFRPAMPGPHRNAHRITSWSPAVHARSPPVTPTGSTS